MIKISELTPKGSNLEATDLLEVSVTTADGYESKSITGAEIITAAQSGLQPTLVSGTNIKTINGNSLLGSGDLVIGGGSGSNIYNTDGTLTGARTLTLGGVALTIAGTTSSRFQANGNVGIGTTTDAGFKLDVNGTARVQNGLTIANVGTYALNVSNGSSNGIGSQYFNAGGTLYWGVNNISGNFLIATNGISYASFFTTTTRALQFGTNQTARLTIFPTTGNIGINTITDVASSLVTMESTTKGFLPPRMTTSQKSAIASPTAGLVVFDTTLNKLCVYTTTWETITSI
jgi:hypothetical protein